MRTVQEILDAMGPELRKNAMKAVDESHMFAVALSLVPSPPVLNGLVEHPHDKSQCNEAYA